jgi:nicotinamidase/pyrazinamidase
MIDFEPPFAVPQSHSEIAHYSARIADFTEAGRRAGLTPASSDSEKIAVVLVDYQHDFVDPLGTLYVPGSPGDIARFLTWFYANAPRITTIYASLDTHIPFQIFYSLWWINAETREHPQPYTVITAQDVDDHVWVPLLEPAWSVKYVHELQQRARKDLMIWPFHTMQGTLGHMLAAPISEAIAWHSAARQAQPNYIAKGLTRRTEFYGIFGAEGPDPRSPSSGLNIPLLDAVMRHDRVYIAGEARSHCVLETDRQIVERYANQPDMLRNLYFLKDCTSSVQHPLIDFDALAEQELAKMQERGVHIVLSTDAAI